MDAEVWITLPSGEMVPVDGLTYKEHNAKKYVTLHPERKVDPL
jgi:hypothetical protein